ncbi:MAG: hypothetical protein IKG46_03290 [Solobacterium sp.]|nr:hypothetical protein [Solobacterium sp.]
MRRRGSLTAEAILALFAAAVTLPAAVSLCASLASIAKFDEQLQDELALQQLQRILMISYDIEAEERELRFTYQGQDRRLLQVNDHVILQPGTMIIFADTEDAYFREEDGTVRIVYRRDGITYEKTVASAP